MARVLNSSWTLAMLDKVNAHEKINTTLNYNIASQWLIMELSKRDIPFKVYNLGAGVKRITTETDVCPCCKKKL